MKKIFILLSVLAVFVLSPSVFGQQEKERTQKNMKLQSGRVAYDLTGEWTLLYKQYDEHYGSLEWIGTYKDSIQVKHEGNKFVGRKVVDGESGGQGAETVRGEFDEKGFVKVQIYRADTGWIACEGRITGDYTRLILNEGNVARATLEKK